jgi:hypothetical protein
MSRLESLLTRLFGVLAISFFLLGASLGVARNASAEEDPGPIQGVFLCAAVCTGCVGTPLPCAPGACAGSLCVALGCTCTLDRFKTGCKC